MPAFSITSDVVSVHAAFLEQPVQLHLVHVANTGLHEKNPHCVSTNHSLCPLVVDDRSIPLFGSIQNASCKTDILKTLEQMKDDEWARQVRTCCGGHTGTQRYRRGDKRARILSFSPIVAIVAPQVSTVGSETLMVELTAPAKGVVMLLTS